MTQIQEVRRHERNTSKACMHVKAAWIVLEESSPAFSADVRKRESMYSGI